MARVRVAASLLIASLALIFLWGCADPGGARRAEADEEPDLPEYAALDPQETSTAVPEGSGLHTASVVSSERAAMPATVVGKLSAPITKPSSTGLAPAKREIAMPPPSVVTRDRVEMRETNTSRETASASTRTELPPAPVVAPPEQKSAVRTDAASSVEASILDASTLGAPAPARASIVPQTDPPPPTTIVHPKSLDPVAPGARLLAIRAGGHEGYDRLVLQFEGPLPGYEVDSLNAPGTRCGSGEAVSVAGSRRVTLRLKGSITAADLSLLREDRTFRLAALREMKLVCRGDSGMDWVLGVESMRRVRVTTLERPTRLVVDLLR